MHTCLNTSLVRCSYSYISSQCSIDSMDICRETPPAYWCTILLWHGRSSESLGTQPAAGGAKTELSMLPNTV